MSSEVLPGLGTDPINVVNIQYWHNVTSRARTSESRSVRAKGSEFIYYRIYHNNRAVATKRPAYWNGIYLGRIRSTWVTPPHTAGSLKRCLSSMENIDPTKTKLFASVSSQSALADEALISLKSNQTLGIVPEEPVIVLLETMPKAGMLAGTERFRVAPDSESPLAPRFLFYGVYNEAGAQGCYAPIDAERPWVSKFDLDSILPSVSVTSLLLILYMRERIKTSSQLLQQDGLTPVGDNQIFTENGRWLGASAEEHLVLKLGSPRTPFTEGSQYTIQNCCTGRSVGMHWHDGSIDLCLYNFRVNDNRPYGCHFTLKLQNDGGVAFRSVDYGRWIAPNCSSERDHGFCFIPSPTNDKNNFFICGNDPVFPKAFYDPGGTLYQDQLELRDWDTTDTRQMWRLIPVPPAPESSCSCC